jgi:hypothetical protein
MFGFIYCFMTNVIRLSSLTMKLVNVSFQGWQQMRCARFTDQSVYV